MPDQKSTLRTFALALALGASTLPLRAVPPVTLMHVHGLSYSADGKQLMIPSHHGLAVFENGALVQGARPAARLHGHHATWPRAFKRSVFISKDQGRTWTQIAKEG